MNCGIPVSENLDDGISCGHGVVCVDVDRVHSVGATEDLARVGVAIAERTSEFGAALLAKVSRG